MKKYQISPTAGKGSREINIGNTYTDQRILLGKLSEVGPRKNVCLDISKEHIVAIVGKRGSGKTHTLGVILEGLSSSDPSSILSVNNKERATLVFDTLNLFQWIGIPLESATGPAAKEQLSKARSWDLPLLEIDAKLWHLAGSEPIAQVSMPFFIQVSEMSPQDWGLLMDVDIMIDPMGQLISTAYDKVTRTGWRTSAVRKNPISNYSINDLIMCINEDVDLLREFTADTRRAVRQRLMSYDSTGLFVKEGTKLQELLKPGQISILLLGRAAEDLRTFVTFLIMRRLLELRSLASEAAKDALIKGVNKGAIGIPKTWVLIDEAQNIIPARTASIANRELTRFVREGRNFGLSMAVSTQQPQAIDPKVMSQVDILIVHTLTVQGDISYVLGNIKSALPTHVGIGRHSIRLPEAIRELEVGQCLISAVESPRAVFTEIRPRISPHGGFEA